MQYCFTYMENNLEKSCWRGFLCACCYLQIRGNVSFFFLSAFVDIQSHKLLCTLNTYSFQKLLKVIFACRACQAFHNEVIKRKFGSNMKKKKINENCKVLLKISFNFILSFLGLRDTLYTEKPTKWSQPHAAAASWA
uniref:Uncharacterized protein n=1 Tax=Micrurus lemniscatus lemniscatus TaxID=129467 RepID=A0A2D4I0F8_MICLE